MGLNLAEKLARQPFFDPKNMGVGGPFEITLSCSASNNANFIKGYDQINWKGKKHDKTMPEMRQDLQGQPQPM